MNYTYSNTFSFTWKFLKRYSGRFYFATFLTALSSAVWLYNAYAFARIVDFMTAYVPGQSITPLYTIGITWTVVVIVRYVTLFLSKNISINIAERAAMDAQTSTIDHLSQLDISWHEKENAGNKIKRIQRGTKTIVDLVKLWIGTIIDILVSFVGALYIISRFDRILAILVIGYLVVFYILAVTTRMKGVRAMHYANIKDEEISGLFYEIVSNIRSVKVLGMAKKVLEYAHASTDEFLRRVKKRIFWFQLSGSVQGIWEGVCQIAFIGFIIWGIIKGNYEVGFLILFYGYFNTLTTSIWSLTRVSEDVVAAKVNIGRVTDILHEPVVIDSEDGKKLFPTSWDALHLKNITFTYGKNSALTNIDLSIKKGEKVGIVGLSGAGKSTLFKLLLKEYENYEGEITIGDISLKDIKKSDYIRHIAAVLQDTEVFNMTLKQNIALANAEEEQNDALFEQSLDIAHVRDFLPKLSHGVDTVIGEKGVKLSGGEKQRLGIARAVFKKPEILFLDEATSHLDVESEQKIQDSLKKFFKNVTAVVIAHRLSTIREMDRIIVIEAGKIIESGTFDELYSQDGRFREFWDKQK